MIWSRVTVIFRSRVLVFYTRRPLAAKVFELDAWNLVRMSIITRELNDISLIFWFDSFNPLKMAKNVQKRYSRGVFFPVFPSNFQIYVLRAIKFEHGVDMELIKFLGPMIINLAVRSQKWVKLWRARGNLVGFCPFLGWKSGSIMHTEYYTCLLYTSDAADE